MSLIPLRRNRVKGYRLTYNGIGIYEALKKEMFNKTHTPDAWIEFKNSPECNWLPLPPTYGNNNASYFTEAGYNKFMELTMPIVNEYISAEDIKTEVSKVPANAIVYEDEYQFVIDTNKQEWDHDNHPYSFDNPNIYMRPATEDDVDNMYAWEMKSIDKSLQEDPKVQQLIRDDCYQSIKDTQMIMDQDKTIGMFTACMIDNGEWRYIGEIYLIPEYRGQHIGSTILKNEIANYDRIRLQVAYDNENALRLYKSLGFKIVKENKEAKLYIMEYDKTKALQEAMSGVNASPVDDNFFIEAVLKAKERNSLKDSEFGIPELRKYPLTDETHINMAVKFFGKAPKKYKLSLAKRILRAAHSHDMDTDGWDTINDYIKNHKESVVQEGFFEVGFGNLRKTIADKLGKFVTVTNVQNPTGKEAKFVIKSNEHPEDYVNVIAMGNGVKAYGYKDSERVSIFNNASLSAAIQKLIDSVCDLFDIQKPINESYTERKNFIMKEQITKILEAFQDGVLTSEEATEKLSTIQEGAFDNGNPNNRDLIKYFAQYRNGEISYRDAMQKVLQAVRAQDWTGEKGKEILKKMSNNWDERYFKYIQDAEDKVVEDFNNRSVKKEGPKLTSEDYDVYADITHKFSQWLQALKALRPEHMRSVKEQKDHEELMKQSFSDPERRKEAEDFVRAQHKSYANRLNEGVVIQLMEKQDKIMEAFSMGIINATEGMRLIERVMMEADYIAEEEDTAYEGDDDDNEPEDITPEDTDGDTVDSDDANIDALADYINSLSDDEKTALMSKLSGSDEPTDDDANGNEEVPTDDASEGEPTTEETVDPASVSDASLNDANASLDDMEV